MAQSPHQPESLADKITRLKADRARKQALLEQIETLGQSTSGGGTTTTYASRREIQDEIHQLDAQIAARTDALNGDPIQQAGVNLLSFRGDYGP